jgi:hypothetical protein
MGCFLMLMLATLMMGGLIRFVGSNGFRDLMRGNLAGWRQSALTGIVAPAIGIVLVAWFTYRFKGIRGPTKRG